MILAETLRKAVKFFPVKQAIICGQNRWTYQEFSDRIDRLSRCLNYLGVGKDDKVAILLPNCHYFLEAYYGIAQIGAISVPINCRLSPAEINFMLQDSEAKILIADPIFQEQVDACAEEGHGIEKILWTGEGRGSTWVSSKQETDGEKDRDSNYERVLRQTDSYALPEPRITDEDIAQIFYTSGTTGRPKGVMLSDKNVYIHALGAIAEVHLTDSDVWAHVAPLFHLADAWATWSITWVGGTHVLLRDFVAKVVLETIEREGDGHQPHPGHAQLDGQPSRCWKI